MRARARIELAATAVGGLRQPMPSPRQSLVLTVDDPGEARRVELGALILTDSGEGLCPGTSATARLDFWDDAADLYVIPGRDFVLRLSPSGR
jgi:hypothetical protein